MPSLKIALLEDNKAQLKERKTLIEENNLAQVTIWATHSTDFLEKVRMEKPDVLMLDIDLGNESLSGIEVASKLKLPVLFVSQYNDKNLKEIEALNLESDFPVDHLSKSFNDEALIKKMTRFLTEVSEYLNSKVVYLDFKFDKRNKISVDSIVCIESETGSSGESNNKRIYFSNRRPETLCDFSFTKMNEYGIDSHIFITTHRSFRVNASKIGRYNSTDHFVEVEVFNDLGNIEKKQIPVSENYRKDVRKFAK